MMYLFYFVGFIIAYIILRKSLRDTYEQDYSYREVIVAFMGAIMSWIIPLFYLIFKIIDRLKDLIDNKPPRWL